jgi:E3 ubiquitin-protein ligase listerin
VNTLPDDFREDFPTSVRAYLLSWHLVYDSYSNASFKVRNDYSDHLKSEGCISPLLEFIFDTLTHTGNRQSISGFDSAMIRSYNMWQATDSESNERNLNWLLANLYYLSLRFAPSLVKSWWVDCKSKQMKLAVEALTRKTFSPLVIEETLEEVAKWAEEQEVTDDEKELIIKISKRSREVFTGYEIDDMMMQIVIRLPESYPLEGVRVDGVNRVAVSEKKWTSWMRIVQGVITFSVRI